MTFPSFVLVLNTNFAVAIVFGWNTLKRRQAPETLNEYTRCACECACECVFTFTAWLGVFRIVQETQLEWLRCQVLGQKCWPNPKHEGERKGKRSLQYVGLGLAPNGFKVKAKRAKASTQWLKITVGYLSTPSAEQEAGGRTHTHTHTATHTQVCCACVNLKGLACVRLCRHMLREFMQVAGTDF